MKVIFALFGVALASTVLVFNLAGAEETQMPAFEEIDADQSGQLSNEESAAVPQLASLFTGADVDRDGQLSPEEYQRAKAHIESK